MKKTVTRAALAALIGAGVSTVALADSAETKGGLKVKTEDGRFEFALGGRIHFDGYVLSEDDGAEYGSVGLPVQGGTAFRRTYLTLTGKAYGWKYKFENDFAAGASPGSYREMWIATTLGPGELTLGQFKPYRGMEELTSSNEITMIERPWTSATGMFAGRQFLMGAGYKAVVGDVMNVGLHLMQLGPANTTTEGSSVGARIAYFPLAEDGKALHVAASYSQDKEQTAIGGNGGSAGATPAVPYAGRRGPVLTLGSAGAATGAEDSAQSTVGLELAGAIGPVTLQGEYAVATLENSHLDAGGTPDDSEVTAYYLQASVFLTGERMPYKKDRAAFGKPKPISEYGAWELVARYDVAENGDDDGTVSICTVSGTAGTFASGNKCEATTITVGTNWYLNPNLRFMLNYYMGEADNGLTQDQPDAVTLRTQFSF